MNVNDLQKQIDELSMRLEASESLSNELKDEIDTMASNKFSMTRTMSPEEKVELGILMEEQIQDVVWDKYIYIFELLGSLDNYAYGGSTAAPALANDLTTAYTIDDYVYAWRPTVISDTFSHDRNTRFKVNIKWVSATTTGPVQEQVSYIRTLNDATALTGLDGDKISSTGFKAVDGELFGVTQFDGNESTIKLKDIEYGTNYVCELKFYPKSRVDFYIDGILLGSLSSNLPASSNNGLNIIDLYIKTTDAIGKTLNVEYFEFMQQRKQ